MWWSCDNRVLVEPRRGRSELPLPSKAIIIIMPEDFEAFTSLVSCIYLRNIFLSRVYKCEDNEGICVVGPLLGAPQAVMLTEKLVALGVREFIALGWCGSLQDHVAIGDVVLPEGALSEEGTSRHYFSDIEVSSPLLPSDFSFLTEELKARDLRFHRGRVWTTDAPYRETIGKVLFYQNKGILAVDMETSAFFSVTRFRGVAFGILLMVSDGLGGLKWKAGMKSVEFLRTRKIILEALRDLVHQRR
ncbi:MAG: nucleoside phosphorylase [Syntrophobacterales bacterium]|nr:nucleoside phosphorylase [Syntrophobacterales bacterium]